MNTDGKAISMVDRKAALSTLWVFVMFNFLYADVVALFDIVYNGKSNASGGSIEFTPGTLLGVSVLMEVPMAMVILSRVLKYRANRWTNIVAGIAYTAVTLIAQFILPISNGTATTYYLFFGAIEILSTLLIVWYAWKWPKTEVSASK
jgi:hypothetical protein